MNKLNKENYKIEDFKCWIQFPHDGIRVVVELRDKCEKCGQLTTIKTWFFDLEGSEGK